MTTTQLLSIGVLTAVCLGGCASPPPAATAPPAAVAPAASAAPAAPPVTAGLQRYRCDQAIEFNVRFDDGTAMLDAGPRGKEVLLRDAGGATPQQTVYSNTRMRAEFGLGSNGREAILRYAQPALTAHCQLQ